MGSLEQMIKASGLDWTIARPGVLRNGSRTGEYCVLTDPEPWRNGIIRRADVADFMVGAAESDDLVGQATVLISRLPAVHVINTVQTPIRPVSQMRSVFF